MQWHAHVPKHAILKLDMRLLHALFLITGLLGEQLSQV